MSWRDRLRESAYTSPGGERITFTYENVSKSVDKKTKGFDFPDADGTYVQDLGHTGRKYPIRVFFWGDTCDLQADVFESVLLERGTGKLEHPIYGAVDVIPFGTITRRDDLKTQSNQVVIEVTFWETIGLIYPTQQSDPSSDVLSSIDDYNNVAANEFDKVVDLDSAVGIATFNNNYKELLKNVSNGLQSVADTQENVQKQFDTVVSSINKGIDILVSQPLTLAFQTLIMIQAPSRALTNINARLNAYENLTKSIVSGGRASESNELHTKSLYASTYVTGSILSVVNTQFTTKTDALNAAETILTQFESVIKWRDDNFRNLNEIDTGDAYQQLQQAVALTAGYLVQISFTLKQERRVTLDRDRTIIDLCAELYGAVDDQLDFLINSNDLTGSEILELPRGREIVYYV